MIQGKVDLGFLVPRFLQRLDERLRRIERALESLEGAMGEPVEAVMREFHSLAGIGGTYGFPEVTLLARQSEVLLQLAMFEGRGLSAGQVEALRESVTRLDAIRLSAAPKSSAAGEHSIPIA